MMLRNVAAKKESKRVQCARFVVQPGHQAKILLFIVCPCFPGWSIEHLAATFDTRYTVSFTAAYAMSQISSIATCFGHVVLAAVTGWSLKYLPSPTGTGVPAVWLMLWCLLTYSVLGIVRFSHPQPGKLLRMLYDQAALLAKVCPLPLLNTQLYLEPEPTLHFALPYRTVLGYAFPLSALVAYGVCNALRDLNRRHLGEYTATGVLLVNAAGLSLVACSTDNYWAMGLVVSFVSKHFLLPVLAERYRIPSALLYTYGLSFYEIFAVNAVADVRASMIPVIM
uniref:Uncharacterized protein n=1 Tax=Anopheles christyi TaxID=43041 RepID=A0A182KGM4_9DIPT